MNTYARLQNGVVAELFSTSANIASLFNPLVAWVDVTGNATVAPGWVLRAGAFVAPPPPIVPAGAAVAVISAASLQAQLATLQSQLASLASTSA